MIRTRSYATIPLGASDGEDFYNSFSIATWGDSLTQGIPGEREPWQDFLAASGLGFRRIYNGGIGGEDSEEIRDRMLADTARHTWATVIWAGRNDKSNFGSWGQRTIDAIADMTDALEAVGNTRYIVLAVTNNGGEYAAAGGTAAANYAEIVALNASLESIYGAKFWDVREWMISDGLAAVGITPTAGDLVDISRDVIPTSLRVDATNVHFNTVGNDAIAIGLVPLLEAMDTTDYVVGYQALVASVGAGVATEILITNQLYLGIEGATYDGKFLEAQPVYLNIYAGHFRGIAAGFDPVFTDNNTIFGTGAALVTPALIGRGNSLFGAMTGTLITSGSFNTVNGYDAGAALVDGQGHTFIGHLAGNAKVAGAGDVAVGRYALAKSTATADKATAVGFQAGYNTTTGYGTFIGSRAGIANTTGIQSVAVGTDALFANETGARYVAIGQEALESAHTTGKAIGIGFQAADNLTTGDGVFIGYLIDAPSATAAGQINISNLLFGTGATGTGTTIDAGGRIGIMTASPIATLDVNGSLATGAPVTYTADFSLALTDRDIRCNKAGSDCVMTPGSAANHTGREFYIMNLSASYAVVSNASNIKQINGANTTAVCPVGQGKWARIKSDGSNWAIMAFGG